MRLPDFTQNFNLLDLRNKMGATEPGNFTVVYTPTGLTAEEFERLSGEGIDVSFDQITQLDDGTLAYKNSRVLLYIRDVAIYDGAFEPPRFHVAFCRTLDRMTRDNRFGRYVVATRSDGDFQINKMNGKRKISSSTERLVICQNCLNRLSWERFSYSKSTSQRLKIVNAFSIQRFFEIYPRSLHVRRPDHDEWTAPLNNYPEDFSRIAGELKESRGWKCEECDFAASHRTARPFLHVHHINGQKNDCRPTNLLVLCIECHAAKPQHSHMRRLPEYYEFLRRFRAE